MNAIISGVLQELLFDPIAYKLAEQRLITLVSHLEDWAKTETHDTTLLQTDSASFLPLVADHSQNIPLTPEWNQRLYTLATDMGLADWCRSIAVARCRQQGWFDYYHHKELIRPLQNKLIEDITPFFEQQGKEHAGTWLMNQGFCRTPYHAERVIEALHPITLEGSIIRVIRRWLFQCQQGALALLAMSDYVFYDDLLLLHQFCRKRHISLEADALLTLRRLLVYLHRALNIINPSLWQQHLLTDPVTSQNRIRYQDRCTAEVYEQVSVQLVHEGMLSHHNALELYEAYINKGFVGLIEYVGSDTEQISIINQIAPFCYGLSPDIRSEIERLVQILNTHIHSQKLPISLSTLFMAMPQSIKRIRLKRQTAKIYRVSKDEESPSSLETHLVEILVKEARLTRKDARQRIRDTLTYGFLGLLPRSVWNTLLDPHLQTWLELIRYGHPERALLWGTVYKTAQLLCHTYNLECPHSQIVYALFNAIPKPRYWHGGKGLMVFKVHQRMPFGQTKRPRLHYRWLITTMALPFPKQKRYGVFIFDEETQLPLGWWVSDAVPTSREVQLALFEAIWHPSIGQYPIRGIPQSLVLSSAWLTHNNDFHQIARWLMLSLIPRPIVSLRGKRRISATLTHLRAWIAEYADIEDSALIQRRIGEYFMTSVFGHHRQTVPRKRIRQHGVIMTGIQSCGAGWCLPVQGLVVKNEDKLSYNGRTVVINDLVASLPNGTYSYRAFPYRFSHEARTAQLPWFIEVHEGEHINLYCCSNT